MARPTDAGSIAESIYSAVEPMQYAEEQEDFALLKYLGGHGQMFQEVEDYAADSADGKPGWSQLVDLSRAPTKALRWLGQFVGVQVPTAMTDQQMRDQIGAHAQWGRGRPKAMQDALKATLVGNKSIIFRERDGDPYFLTVESRLSETPDYNASLTALLTQKPAGIILTYIASDFQDYQTLFEQNADYQMVYERYATYEDVLQGNPRRFGKTDIGGTWSGNFPSNYKGVTQFTALETGTIIGLWVYMRNTNTGTQPVKGLIHRDTSNAPGTLAAVGTEVVIPTSMAAGWKFFPMPNTAITANEKLWLGYHAGVPTGSAGVNVAFTSPGNGTAVYQTGDTYADGPADPFGTPTGSDGVEVSIYAVYNRS